MNIPGCDLFGRKTLESLLFPTDLVVSPVISGDDVFHGALLRPMNIVPEPAEAPTFTEIYPGTIDFYGEPEGPVPSCIEAAMLGALAAKTSLSSFRG